MLRVTLDTFLRAVYEMNLFPCFLVGSRQDDNLERDFLDYSCSGKSVQKVSPTHTDSHTSVTFRNKEDTRPVIVASDKSGVRFMTDQERNLGI